MEYEEHEARPHSSSEFTLMDYDEGENCATSNDNRQQQEEREATCQHQCTDSSSMDSWNFVGNVETIRTETAETEFSNVKRIVAELQQLYPDYAKCFLSCQRCVSFGILRPHCKCGEENSFIDHEFHGCVQMCPDLTNCTKDKRQLSHCPTCFNIGKGISGHKTLSSIIDVYVCANCAEFITYWNQKKNKGKLEKLTCESKLDRTGNCLQDRQRNCRNSFDNVILKQLDLVGERRKQFCTWCRLKLMQLLGFKMTDEVQKALEHPDPEQRKFLQSFDSDQNNSESNGLTTVNGLIFITFANRIDLLASIYNIILLLFLNKN